MTSTPPGSIYTSAWLNAQGIDHKLIWWYWHSGWIEKIGPKIYKKIGSSVSWADVICTIQDGLNLPIYIGGKAALQLLGKAHYLPLGDTLFLDLYTLPSTSLPSWISKLSLEAINYKIHKILLFDSVIHTSLGLTKKEINGVDLSVSAPERAIMEVFYDVPQNISYEESILLMENLDRLRPQVVQTLLENCKSIKVKRLFLHAAEKFQHEWLNDVELNKIDLGKGKRRIGEGGDYDSKYQLSVPHIRGGEVL